MNVVRYDSYVILIIFWINKEMVGPDVGAVCFSYSFPQSRGFFSYASTWLSTFVSVPSDKPTVY